MRRLAHHFRLCLAIALAFALVLPHAPAMAQTQASELDLKAAIIANMLLFIEWPVQHSAPSDSLTICYLESSPVATALIRLDGKAIKGKILKVIRTNPDSLSECQAIYFSPGNPAALTRTMTVLRSSAVLLAGDSPEYMQKGIMLNLELVSGRIVFDFDLRSAQKVGLQVSSKALRLARQVID
jgi:hypothetical protein